MSQFSGKVALITGGSSGIGLATAQALEAAGAKVVINGRNPETLQTASASLNGNHLAVRGDVSKFADLEQLFQRTVDHFGKIDILFVNAGVIKMAPLDQVDESFYDWHFNINVKGAYFTVQKALPHLNDGASIILNTSITNQLGFAGASVYSATKAALRSFARTFSAELIGRGIRVNAVSPGPISTPIYGKLEMPKEALDAFASGMQERIPLKRFGQPEEIAKAVLFLASEDASFIVGAELAVDGGFTQL
ncbi:MAG: glucose 1-dehydrogenase [Bacteroidota bacterium]